MWALAAAGAAYWGLRLFAAAPPVPPHAQTANAAAAPRGDLTRLFGVDAPPPSANPAAPPEPAPDARFQLVGVVSPRSAAAAREGLALIAVDGKPPRAFRVGAVVDGAQVLKSVNLRGATLGPRDGAAVVALNLQPPPAAATGTLPGAGMPTPVMPGAPLPPPAYPGNAIGARPAVPGMMPPVVRRGLPGVPPQVAAQPAQGESPDAPAPGQQQQEVSTR